MGLATLTPAQTPAVGATYCAGDVKLVHQGAAADLCVAREDYKVANIAAGDLAADIERVTGLKLRVKETADGLSPHAVLIGTLGHSATIDALVRGSDRRGTAFGAYDLSREIGVSPWYWWADIPPQQRDALLIRTGRYRQRTPFVKYRGIFINDEGWGIRP